MTKQVIIQVIINPFWAWLLLLIVFGFAGAVFGVVTSWLTSPRYIVVHSYSVRRKRVDEEVTAPKTVAAKPKRLSLVQRLEEFRKRFQPIIEEESIDDWEEAARFRRAWHHKKYRSFLRREYGIALPKGKVIVYSRWGEYAVRVGKTYYVIPWK